MSEGRGAAATKAKPNQANGRLIEVRGLDKTFYDADREIRVLHGLDLTVQAGDGGHRSEERRAGKECRSRWSPYH